MYIWYYARKINNSFIKFIELGKYTRQIVELSEDDTIPKFSTHLIYLTKANSRGEIEEKIIKSIFAKKPKRADVYWFVHINRTEHPYTLNYGVSELINDKVIKLTIDIGFRLQARTELYFKKILQELVINKELNLHIRPDGSTKYNPEPDFKFVVFEKFLSVENEFHIREGVILTSYFLLKRLAQTDQKAFGLDKSDVTVEQVPIVYHPVQKIELAKKSI
jgi:KUP system potassium uptake protein